MKNPPKFSIMEHSAPPKGHGKWTDQQKAATTISCKNIEKSGFKENILGVNMYENYIFYILI